MRKPLFLLLGALAAMPAPARAQTVFHSTQSANLPTAAMLPGGSWLFEISHRFGTPISEGVDHLWGLDGPAAIRLGLTWSPHDRLMLTAQRTNFEDNVELSARFRGFAIDSETLPIEVSAQGGVAWNTQVVIGGGAADDEMQAYVALIANALIADRLAIGVVPAALRNPRILDADSETAFTLGLHAQLYTESAFSFFGEWVFSEERVDLEQDVGALGVEIETRGHFFKILVSNSVRLNATQVLGGTGTAWSADNLVLGFNITRLLPF